MSGVTQVAGTATAVLGTQIAATKVPALNKVASGLLPLTGAAVGLYVVIALCLLVAGFVLQHFGQPEEES